MTSGVTEKLGLDVFIFLLCLVIKLSAHITTCELMKILWINAKIYVAWTQKDLKMLPFANAYSDVFITKDERSKWMSLNVTCDLN